MTRETPVFSERTQKWGVVDMRIVHEDGSEETSTAWFETQAQAIAYYQGDCGCGPSGGGL